MGAKTSSLSNEQFQQLQQNTHYTVKELKAMQAQFAKEHAAGNSEVCITRAQFQSVMLQIGVADSFLQDILFGVFDKDKDQKISFQEFAAALSVIVRGDTNERLLFAFQLFDLNGSGFIERAELSKILDAFFKVAGGPVVTFSGKRYDNSEQFVAEFFDAADKNNDGKISFQDYSDAALKNPDIVQGLGLLRT